MTRTVSGVYRLPLDCPCGDDATTVDPDGYPCCAACALSVEVALGAVRGELGEDERRAARLAAAIAAGAPPWWWDPHEGRY